MTGRDFKNEKMIPYMVYIFPQDKERLEEIAEDNDKYETTAHAARCALQAFIRKHGEVE